MLVRSLSSKPYIAPGLMIVAAGKASLTSSSPSAFDRRKLDLESWDAFKWDRCMRRDTPDSAAMRAILWAPFAWTSEYLKFLARERESG